MPDEVGEAETSQVESVTQKELTQKQVEFIGDIYSSDNLAVKVSLYGGYCEEALLNGRVTTDHHDVDALITRTDMEAVREGFENLGCHVEEVAHPGTEETYKFLVKRGDVECDVAFIDWDEERNQPYAEADRPDGTRVKAFFDKDTFNHPLQKLGDIDVRVVSPLMQMQMRTAFVMIREGRPRQQDINKQEALRQRFYPEEDSGSEKFNPEIVEL